MKRLLLPLAIAGVFLSACGGGSVRAPVKAHPCDPHNYYMQCALTTPKVKVSPPAQALAYGVDFAWSCPNPVGHNFGASYASYDRTKNWTQACVNLYHSHGAKTVVVWETQANRATQGFAAGQSDAAEAKRQAAALGNTNRPIDFAVDCQCAPPSVFPYFKGVHSVLGGRDDAYADYDVILYLYRAHVVGDENWQTYAWSGGRWLPASIAPLEQYLNDNIVDYDRAIGPRYGQYPYSAPKPPPSRPVCFGPHEQSTATCTAVRAQVAKWSRAHWSTARALAGVEHGLAANHCVKPYRRGVCIHLGRVVPVLRQREAWFQHKITTTVKEYS